MINLMKSGKRWRHWCGMQGYGLGINDVCPACYASKLKEEGKTAKEIENAIAKAIASVR
jgi:hypothetical protein